MAVMIAAARPPRHRRQQQAQGGRARPRLRGGDRFTELGGFEQTCGFDKDLYFNPGPWRIPYHHRGILDYCVVNGSKDMPPFGTLLDDEQVAAVVNYVRSHCGNSYRDPVSPADVRSARP